LERSGVDSGYQTSDVSKIDTKIYDSLVKIKSAVADNDIQLSEQHKNDVVINFNKRYLITNNIKNYGSLIDKLHVEKQTLTSSLQTPLSTVYSQKSGYFSTLLDGYETVFTPNVLDNLTIDSYHELITKDKIEYNNLAIGKIVTGFNWNTICEVSAKEAEDLSEGKRYPVTFLYSSGQQIEAILEKKITQTNAETVILVLKIEEIPQNFDYTRNQTIRIIKNSTEGIGFPRHALRLVDGVQGVYVISGNSVGFKQVDIVSKTGSMYYSREFSSASENNKNYLTRFDRIITEGKDLYVGKILD
jgi:hypothetical protein